MRLFGFEIKRAKKTGRNETKRSYDAGLVNRLFADWIVSQKTADEEIKYNLKTIRARSRNLVINNDYARKFKKMVYSSKRSWLASWPSSFFMKRPPPRSTL